MKKLLAVATVAVVGYKVVKKLRNKNKEFVIENIETGILADNDNDNIKVEDIEIVDANENIKTNKRKNTIKARILVPLAKLGIVLIAYVKCVIEVNKEEKTEFNKKKQIVDKFKQEYYKYMNI